MGNRVVIYITGAPCGVYLHWDGRKTTELIQKAAPRMRPYEPGYAMARLIGTLHESHPGMLGMGVIPPPGDDLWQVYSQGDAGVIVLDVGGERPPFPNIPPAEVRLTAKYYAGHLADREDCPADFGPLVEEQPQVWLVKYESAIVDHPDRGMLAQIRVPNEPRIICDIIGGRDEEVKVMVDALNNNFPVPLLPLPQETGG